MNKKFSKHFSIKEQLFRLRMWIGALLLRNEYDNNPALREFIDLDADDFEK